MSHMADGRKPTNARSWRRRGSLWYSFVCEPHCTAPQLGCTPLGYTIQLEPYEFPISCCSERRLGRWCW